MSEHIPHAQASPRLKLVGVLAAAVAVAAAGGGIWSRMNHESELKKEVAAQHVTVKVVKPKKGGSDQPLILPGDVRAEYDAPIYARVSGYLKAWYTDIGARVKKGQVLGEIETPELDQQILRAEADVASAQSNWEIADLTARRWQNLLASDSVSHQEADEKAAAAKSRNDALNAARANLKGLLAQQAFNKVTAPFDGIVTERNTDIGKLINPGSASGQALFRVVDARKLRVYVEVPQNYSQQVRPGMKAEIDFPERPGQHFSAVVAHLSNAIHENSRTSTVEVLMDNPGEELFPGSYAEAHFNLGAGSNLLQLPASALLFRKEGLEVATVDETGHVVLKHIVIARDLGRTVEVASGVDENDRVIDSPSDSTLAGDAVQVAAPQAASGVGEYKAGGGQ